MTTNKTLNTPLNGSFPGHWDVPMNQNFTIIDASLATIYSLPRGSTTVPYTLNNIAFTVDQSYGPVYEYQVAGFEFIYNMSNDTAFLIPAGISGIWQINARYLTTNGFNLTFDVVGGNQGPVNIFDGEIVTIISDGAGMYRTHGRHTLVVNSGGNFAVPVPNPSASVTVYSGSPVTVVLPDASASNGGSVDVWNFTTAEVAVVAPATMLGPLGPISAGNPIVLGANQYNRFTSDGQNWFGFSSGGPITATVANIGTLELFNSAAGGGTARLSTDAAGSPHGPNGVTIVTGPGPFFSSYFDEFGNLYVAGAIYKNGSTPVVTLADFANTLAQNGAQALPSGLSVQWGFTDLGTIPNGTSTSVAVPFSPAFPTQAFAITLGAVQSAANCGVALQKAPSASPTGFNVFVWNNSGADQPMGVSWTAIGA